MKVLCLCPIGIGNYLLCYPAFSLLRRSLPDAELHLLALRSGVGSMAANDPLWNCVHCIDPDRERSLMRIVVFMLKLQHQNFTASYSFFPANTWQYNLVPLFCGCRRRHALGYPLKKGASLSFLNNRLLPIDPALHDVDQNLRLVAHALGIQVDNSDKVFPVLFSEKEKSAAAEMLAGFPGPKKFIAVHPGSSPEHGMDAKRWDPMRFGELADRICSATGSQALIFGSADEDKIKLVTVSIMKQPRHVIEQVSLQMTAALLSQCTMLLANDSGLMHMAACMGVPTAAVFGPTDERRNGPVGTGNLIIRKKMDGFPLWTAATAGVRAVPGHLDPRASLRALSVGEAWGMVEPWLETIGACG